MAGTDKRSSTPLPPKLTPAEQLLLEIFDGQANVLFQPFDQWVAASKLFLAFAQKYLSKIRKKIRMSRDVEETYNLYCELRTAYLLLHEPKFEVAYELYGKEQGRSADFAVTYRTNTPFHVEVTRLRISQQEQQLIQQAGITGESGLEDQLSSILRYESRRLVDVVCDKFKQLSPDTPNILWMWSESRTLHQLDIGQVMVELKRRVEQRDADLFARYGFGKPADFLRYYQRLGVIVIQSLNEQGPNSPLLWWQNNDAKHPLPSKVATLLRSQIAADTSQRFITNLH